MIPAFHNSSQPGLLRDPVKKEKEGEGMKGVREEGTERRRAHGFYTSVGRVLLTIHKALGVW